MTNDVANKWAWTVDEEHYDGPFDTWEEAAQEAGTPGETVLVGQCRAPGTVEYIDAALLIDRILEHDDYGMDCAEHSLSYSQTQLDELTTTIRAAFTAWMDKHGLRPNFFVVDSSKTVEVPALTTKG